MLHSILELIFYWLFIGYLFMIYWLIRCYSISIDVLLVICRSSLLFWLLFISLISSNLFTCLYSNYNLYISIISHNNYYPLSFFMVITVIIVSSIILYNSLSYLSIIDSYLFLLYIILFQFSMINFILSDDIITTYFYWDLLGIISYVLVNYWSSKINCGIKAIIYNNSLLSYIKSSSI